MKIPGAITAVVLLASAGHAAAWEKLADCKLLPNRSNDGDSFHVEHEGKEYIFRLYFVDAPETSRTIESRVAEQAAHFGVSQRAVLRSGKKAEEFTAKALRGKFEVLTRFEDAMGASRMKRNYAVVRTREKKDLGMLLAENGLARTYGLAPRAPGAPLKSEYQRAEDRARRKKIGIFAEKPAAEDNEASEPEESARAGEETMMTGSPLPTATPANETAERLPVEAQVVGLATEDALAVSAPSGSPAARSETAVHTSSTPGGKVSLNNATQTELESLPEIGPVLAKAIIAGRPYAKISDIDRVPGIGPSKLQAILPFLTE